MRKTTDPTPQQSIEMFAQAIDACRERFWEENSGANLSASSADEWVTLHDVRRELARIMKSRGFAFSSDYRHEATPAHALALQLIGSTVGINVMMDDMERKARVA